MRKTIIYAAVILFWAQLSTFSQTLFDLQLGVPADTAAVLKRMDLNLVENSIGLQGEDIIKVYSVRTNIILKYEIQNGLLSGYTARFFCKEEDVIKAAKAIYNTIKEKEGNWFWARNEEDGIYSKKRSSKLIRITAKENYVELQVSAYN